MLVDDAGGRWLTTSIGEYLLCFAAFCRTTVEWSDVAAELLLPLILDDAGFADDAGLLI